MKPLKLALTSCALAVLPALATAQVYKQVDPSGRVIYTDKPAEGAQKLDLPPVTTVPAVKPPAKDQPAGNAAEGGAGRGDAARKEAKAKLEEAERKLDAARRELAEQEQVRLGGEATNYQKYLDRVQPYKDAVSRQQLEVEALRKEAGN